MAASQLSSQPWVSVTVQSIEDKALPATSGRHRVSDGVEIHWERHTIGQQGQGEDQERAVALEPLRLVLIQGFASGAGAWSPLLDELTKLWEKHSGQALEVLCVENRGIGRSGCPKKKSSYSTGRLASDVLEVMNHLEWHAAHVCGFSMGGMVATKLAAVAPHRVKSLVKMSVTGGNMQSLPHSWKAFKLLIKGLLAKTPLDRARVDLKFHFSSQILRRMVSDLSPARSVRDILLNEYVENAKQHGPQPKQGFDGQLHAIFNHSVKKTDVQQILEGGFPIWYLHGRNDIIAMPKYAERLAARFSAPCVYFTGGHQIFRENAAEVAVVMRSILTDLSVSKRSLAAELKLNVSTQQGKRVAAGVGAQCQRS